MSLNGINQMGMNIVKQVENLFKDLSQAPHDSSRYEQILLQIKTVFDTSRGLISSLHHQGSKESQDIAKTIDLQYQYFTRLAKSNSHETPNTHEVDSSVFVELREITKTMNSLFDEQYEMADDLTIKAISNQEGIKLMKQQLRIARNDFSLSLLLVIIVIFLMISIYWKRFG